MIGAVTVFCGSSDVVDAKYFAVAVELGEKLAKRRWRLVYGGGRVGLMGALSRSVLEHGGLVCASARALAEPMPPPEARPAAVELPDQAITFWTVGSYTYGSGATHCSWMSRCWFPSTFHVYPAGRSVMVRSAVPARSNT